MRILTTRAGFSGYGTASGNPGRLSALDRALDTADQRRVGALFGPGGYLLADSDDMLTDLVEQVRQLACKDNRKASVALGIDKVVKEIPDGGGDEAWVRRQITCGGLPWFVVHVEPQTGRTMVWSQRSTTSKDACLAPSAVCVEERTIRVGSGAVETAGCGEIYNGAIRTSVLRRSPGLSAWVALVHRAGGFRFARTFKAVSQHGLNCFMSAHAHSPDAVNVAYTAGAVRAVPSWTGTIPGTPTLCLREWVL